MSSRLVVNSVRHTGASADGITLDSSGNVTFPANATCSGTATGFGKFTSYAIIGDQKSSGTAGGALTSGDWRTHDLQTEFSDPDGIVSISSNQFTLQAGTYLITYRTIAYAVASSVAKIYKVLPKEENGEIIYEGSSWHDNDKIHLKNKNSLINLT